MNGKFHYYYVVLFAASLGLFVGVVAGSISEATSFDLKSWLGATSGWVGAAAAIIAVLATIRSIREQISAQYFQYVFDSADIQLVEFREKISLLESASQSLYHIDDHMENICNSTDGNWHSEYSISKDVVVGIYLNSLIVLVGRVPVDFIIYLQEVSSIVGAYFSRNYQDREIAISGASELRANIAKFKKYFDDEILELKKKSNDKLSARDEIRDRILKLLQN
ncbi:hypothetical protein [Pannonibacter phragmitetus]|uniref:hypothetical protein n=1 Tax=Pannonibacter phragmitetus TaxID=121719 RepID=UPI000AACF6BC|nr:hypothetical protein [Pannonibacter phragmitetus]